MTAFIHPNNNTHMTKNDDKGTIFPADLIKLPLTFQQGVEIMENRKRRKVLCARIDALEAKRDAMVIEHEGLECAEATIIADAAPVPEGVEG